MIQIIYYFSLFICLSFISCNGQKTSNKKNELTNNASLVIGGGCEGCELMYINMPKKIYNQDTSLGWNEGVQKLIIKGIIYQKDGITPASNILVYYWHTDDMGLYSSNAQTPIEVIEHGKLRGWIQTDKTGEYSIFTSKPASYPNQDIPQHIHLSIKEPNITKEYYADLYFADDPLYPNFQKKYGKLDRAGNELLNTITKNSILLAEHNIILGQNIPNYPK
ncbi:MAG: hypothetical protein E6Q95_06500 [Chitinophagaceae bacterium]|nr:MAG: hypothetical protein E6Q95_06500 [Chitinophagaceae bacterium]